MRALSTTATVLAVLLAAAPVAHANGRPAGVSTLNFRQGHPQDIVAGLTFGMVVSHDGGATWQWMCEKAVGYAGLYDPDYKYSSSSAIFATTFNGLTVNRNACTFDATPPGTTFVSRIALGPDGALYYAAADPADAKIYKSTDDGITFPQSASPGINDDYWESLVVAPSNASRIYLTGYRFVKQCSAASSNPGATCSVPTDCPGGSCDNTKAFLLFTSADGGATFTPMVKTGITTSPNSSIDIVGVSPTDPKVVYAISTVVNGTLGDALYKSTDAGATWTQLLTEMDTLHFVARANGTCVVATQTLGAFSSAACDTTWTPLTSPPHINCLAEDTNGTIWACTQNYGQMGGIPSDGFGIMKTSDLATWSGALRFQDIQGPVQCAAGTVQQDQCVAMTWCSLETQLGITSTVVDCAAPAETIKVPTTKAGGCCEAGGGEGAVLGGFGGLALLGVGRLRRRRARA